MSIELLGRYERSQTVCFTGHRPERLPREPEGLTRLQTRLTRAIEDAIQRGKTNFISGAMSGFDTLAAEHVIALKEKHPQIRCILVAPYSVRYFHSKSWTPEWEARLKLVVERADLSIWLSENWYRGAYYARDRVIVDASSEVIAYYDGGAGGTRYTVNYAKVQGKPVGNMCAPTFRA